MLRIISGKYRRLLINRPPREITRPTKDNIRESIINSLRFDLENKNVIDLFAGSGALGIEMLSNGASHCVFIEKNHNVFNILKQNIESLKIDNSNTYKSDAVTYLSNVIDTKFDFILIDPPYKQYDLVTQVLNLIIEKNLLNDSGKIVVETDDISQINLPNEFKNIQIRKFGKVNIIYLSK